MNSISYDTPRFRICGDRAVLTVFGEGISKEVNLKVRSVASLLEKARVPGVEATVVSYCSLLLVYDPLQINISELQQIVLSMEDLWQETPVDQPVRIELPVCYGGQFGPDIEWLAQRNGLRIDELIQIHSAGEYHIYAIGFTPGFCYLGGLDQRLHAPRRETPRVRVVAGTVGIAGAQTGVYPVTSPGGWQLIGRTPLRLFWPERQPPVSYKPGDSIVFRAISMAEFSALNQWEGIP